MDEAQEQAGVAVHRAGDVADDDEGPGADLSFLAAQLERDAAVAQRAAQGGAGIDELAMFGPYPAPRLAGAEAPGEPLDDAACLGDLVGCALGEVLLRSVSRELKSMTSSGEASNSSLVARSA